MLSPVVVSVLIGIVLSWRLADTHLPPVNSGSQDQTSLSLVLKEPGRCGSLVFQPWDAHPTHPSTFLPHR